MLQFTLILTILYGGNVSITSVEFNSEASCLAAALQISEKYSEEDRNSNNLFMICVQK